MYFGPPGIRDLTGGPGDTRKRARLAPAPDPSLAFASSFALRLFQSAHFANTAKQNVAATRIRESAVTEIAAGLANPGAGKIHYEKKNI